MSFEFQSTLVDVTPNYRIGGSQIGGARIEMIGDTKTIRVVVTNDADVRFALTGPFEYGDPDAIYSALSSDLYEVATGILLNEGAVGSVEHSAEMIRVDLEGDDRPYTFRPDAEVLGATEVADHTWKLTTTAFAALRTAAAAWRSSMDGTLEGLATAISNETAARIAADAVIQADVDQNEADGDAADATLQANIDAEEAARIAADGVLQADIDQNEADGDAADATLQSNIDAEAAARTAADGVLQAAIDAVQLDVDGNEADSDAAEAALSGRLDVLEADPVTKTYVDAADTTLQSNIDSEAGTRASADSAIDARLDVLEADPTTATAVAAVQSDVDANEADSDAADAALSARLDVLEADPTTATAVAAVQADVDQNESDADAAIALKLDASAVSAYGLTLVDDADAATARTTLGLGTAATTDASAYATAAQGALADTAVQPAAISNVDNTSDADKPVSTATQAALDLKAPIADPDFTGQLEVDVNLRLEFDSNLTKIHNILRGTSIEIGNNIQMKPAAAGGRVEIAGALQVDITEVPEAANDTQAAAAGIIVGGLYRSNSVLHIRVS